MGGETENAKRSKAKASQRGSSPWPVTRTKTARREESGKGVQHSQRAIMSMYCRRKLWDCAICHLSVARCQPPIVQNLRRLGCWGWVSVLDRRTLGLLKRGFLVSRGVNKPQSRVETRSQRRDAGVPTGGELYIPVQMYWPLVFAQRVGVGARC